MKRPNLARIDELDNSILNLCTRINSATYELLVMIRKFDERAGWLHWSLDNCAEWLAWRCDLSMTTAREKVRVAHALKTLPRVSEAFATGEVSYTKVHALTRVADRDNEQALLDFALRNTAAVVAERCRELRCGSEASLDAAARAVANRSLRIRRDPHRGMITITVELPTDAGELVEKALEKAHDDEPLGIGRKSRIVPAAIARAVRARDHDRCTFPGCNNRRFLQCHHVEHWSNGGETSLENLMLLCTAASHARARRQFSDRKGLSGQVVFRQTGRCCGAGVRLRRACVAKPSRGRIGKCAEEFNRRAPASRVCDQAAALTNVSTALRSARRP
jgi:hypothetical protein